MPDTFDQDIFISYSSVDRPWASKLNDALINSGITTFFDQTRIDIGTPWEPQLTKAVQRSQHLLVVHSNKAKDSDWVRKEYTQFELIKDITPADTAPVKRRLIFLMLEGENRAYSSYQMIDDLKVADAYAKGIANLEPGLWQDVIDKIVATVQDDDPAMRIPLAILAMKESELAALDPAQERLFGFSLDDFLSTLAPGAERLPEPNPARRQGFSLNEFLGALDLGTAKDLIQRYGDSRADWRPFGSSLNIKQILNKLSNEINQAVEEPKVRWEPIDEAFWTDYHVSINETTKLLERLSLIVIDPVSLFVDHIFDKLRFLSKCFESDNANIMVLSPFSVMRPMDVLRGFVERRGYPLFNLYFDPPIPFSTYANCGVNVNDEKDIKRLLRASLGQYVRRMQPPSKSTFLRQR